MRTNCTTPGGWFRASCVAAALLACSAEARADDAAREAAAPLPDDTITTPSGTLPFTSTYEAGLRPGRREPHYVRAAFVDVGVLVLGTAYYWIWPSLNRRDWDYPDWQTRMRQLRPTFDNNLHFTNHVLHPLAGSLYYGLARVNGLPVAAATTYAIGSSALFEFVFEWLEKASINDLIFTPLAGVPAGEFFLHLGDYVNSSPEGRWYHGILGTTMGAPHRVQRLIDGELITQVPPSMGADSLGFSSYYWHRFRTSVRASAVSNDKGETGWVPDVAFEGRIVSIPGFLQPGRFQVSFDEGDFTEMRLEVASGAAALPSVDLWFDANLWGRYRQDIDRKRVGSAYMVALDTSYRFFDREVLDRHDQYAMVDLFGPAMKYWWLRGDLTLSFEGAAHLDFAAVRSNAYPLWVDRHGGTEGTRSVLIEHGYDYEIGWSAWARAAAQLGGAELGARGFFGSYGSLDCCDRFPEKIDAAKNAHDSEKIVELDAWLHWTPAPAPVELSLFATHRGHTSAMGEFVVKRWDRRFGAGLGLVFLSDTPHVSHRFLALAHRRRPARPRDLVWLCAARRASTRVRLDAGQLVRARRRRGPPGRAPVRHGVARDHRAAVVQRRRVQARHAHGHLRVRHERRDAGRGGPPQRAPLRSVRRRDRGAGGRRMARGGRAARGAGRVRVLDLREPAARHARAAPVVRPAGRREHPPRLAARRAR